MVRNKIAGIARLFRPELSAAAGVCVVLGQVLALGGLPPGLALLNGFLCGFFMSGCALVLNDVFDLEVDRINAPQRPLPSGLVAPREAAAAAAASFAAGVLLSAPYGIPALALCIVFGVVGILYNWKYKESGLPGNLMVCSSVAVTFILGATIVGNPWSGVVWLFSLLVFFFDLAEEVAGDAMDMEGDRLRGSRSLAILWGRQAALRISALLFGLVVLVSLLPYALGFLGLSYLAVMLAMDAVLVVFVIRLVKSQTPAEGRRAMRVMYLAGSVGLLAFLILRLAGG